MTNSRRLRLLVLFTPVITFLAHAGITSLCDVANPCTAMGSVTEGVTTTVPMVWRGSAEAFAGTMQTITSTGGIYRLNNARSGPVIGTSDAVVTHMLGAGTGVVDFTINESLSVPASISEQAAAVGAARIYFTRQFSTGGSDGSVSGTQVLNVVAGIGPTDPTDPGGVPPRGNVRSGVVIDRIAVRFDTGNLTEVIGKGAPLQAIVNVNHQRAGLFDAVWEVAGPATTGGQPIFRPLHYVRQFLGAGREAVLQSPSLPTNSPGLYLLRLRVVQPEGLAAPIVLRYQVVERSLGEPARVKRIKVTQPSAATQLKSDTLFRWQAQENARAYQLELYNQPGTADPVPGSLEHRAAGDNETAALDDAPTTGILIPSDHTSTTLSPSVFGYLTPGETYYWRVIAIDAAGTIVAASALRDIRVNAEQNNNAR